jgi:hypothetical protein
MDYSPWFDRFWVIFTPFEFFFSFKTHAFWGVFGQKAWTGLIDFG